MPHAWYSQNMAPSSLTWIWEGMEAWWKWCSVKLGRDHSILFTGTFAFGALNWPVRNPAIPRPSCCEEAQASHMERPWVGFLFGSPSWVQLLCHHSLDTRCIQAKKSLPDSNLKRVTSCLREPPASGSTDKPPPLGSPRAPAPQYSWASNSCCFTPSRARVVIKSRNRTASALKFSYSVKPKYILLFFKKESSEYMNFWFEEKWLQQHQGRHCIFQGKYSKQTWIGLVTEVIYWFTQVGSSSCESSTSGPWCSGDDWTLILSDSGFCFVLCCLHFPADTPRGGVGWPWSAPTERDHLFPRHFGTFHWPWLDPSSDRIPAFHPWLWPWESGTLIEAWATFLPLEPEDVYEFLTGRNKVVTSCVRRRRNRCSLRRGNRYSSRQNFLVPIWLDPILLRLHRTISFIGFVNTRATKQLCLQYRRGKIIPRFTECRGFLTPIPFVILFFVIVN